MYVFDIMNVIMTQRRGNYVNISMDISAMLNVVTTQLRWFCAIILMDEFRNINVLTTQLGTSCSFDSPGLARNEPTPGKHSQVDSTL